MCVLVVGIDVHPGRRLFVAANRDEQYARPASPPKERRVGQQRVLMPVDVRAGGTWEGVNEAGLVAVITNRRDGDFDAARPSRGLLCAQALAQSSAVAVRDSLAKAIREQRYNSFNLFYGDTQHAFVSSWNGELVTQKLAPGVHTLTNRHALGELPVPEVAHLVCDDLDALRDGLIEILASHTPRDADGFQICKHGEHYGSVSSSLVHVDAGGHAVLEYAAGPACSTTFVAQRLEPNRR